MLLALSRDVKEFRNNIVILKGLYCQSIWGKGALACLMICTLGIYWQICLRLCLHGLDLAFFAGLSILSVWFVAFLWVCDDSSFLDFCMI